MSVKYLLVTQANPNAATASEVSGQPKIWVDLSRVFTFEVRTETIWGGSEYVDYVFTECRTEYGTAVYIEGDCTDMITKIA